MTPLKWWVLSLHLPVRRQPSAGTGYPDHLHTISHATPLSLLQGAAAAAYASAKLLHLASDKAAYGHAEPAAGIVGGMAVLRHLHERMHQPVLYLSTVNPHVQETVETAEMAGLAIVLPRQMRANDQSSKAAGISSFAFQGTGLSRMRGWCRRRREHP